MLYVLDLSHWNWKNGVVNLQVFVDLGVDGFIFKATQGTWLTDDCFKECVRQAKELKKPYSLYHFLDPIQDGYQDGNEQWEYFMDETQGYRSLAPNGLDVEWQGDLSRSQLVELTVDFLSNPGEWLTYSNLNFFDYILRFGAPEIAAHSDLWLSWPAAWAMKPRMPKYYLPSEVKLWQKDWNWHGVDLNIVMDETWWREKFAIEENGKAVPVTLSYPRGAIDLTKEEI